MLISQKTRTLWSFWSARRAAANLRMIAHVFLCALLIGELVHVFAPGGKVEKVSGKRPRRETEADALH